ncbi:hypothetical protein CJ030_MR1G018420 [Morella rubra]|uniref:TMV resistance protein N n=1 Tax=Morella rubra TaxID=262757 RepID=A0A6A1WL20_9ROSI|nr:hypothetical protein CJ030_MR1G018414 [Morella rubra]KAB1226001.1 hypothetical protein CJ030_MR1G018420 [Morella rubra]
MVRFVQLKHLVLDDCKQLLQIPELPSNIAVISATGCTSLKRLSQLSKILWQFNESGLQALEKVDVTGCHKLECFVPKTSMFQGYKVLSLRNANYHYFQCCAFVAVFLGSTKPDSLLPCKENSGVFEIDIGALRNSNKIIRGIVLYLVFGPTYGKCYVDVDDDDCKGGIQVHDSRGRNFEVYGVLSTTDSMRSDHVLLLYISAIDIERYHMEHIQVLSNDSDLLVIKYCGFYPVYMNDEEEATKDKSEMLCEGVNSNMESHSERKRKYSSTFDTQISSLEDGIDDAREVLDSKV